MKTAEAKKTVAKLKINSGVIKAVVFSLIAFFVSDAQVMGSLSPFGLALTAAVPLRMAYVSFIGCLSGYLVRGSFFESLSQLAALVLILAGKQFVRPYRKLRDNTVVLSSMAGGASLISGIILFVITKQSGTFLFLKVLEAALAAGMTLFCRVGYKAVFGGKPLHMYDMTESASCVIVGIMTVLSLCGVEWYGNSLGRITAVFLILGAAYCGGIGGCATISIAAAIAMTLYSPSLAVIGGIYVVAGFIAAIFRPAGKVGQIAVFISVNVFGLLVVKAEKSAIYSLTDVLIGTTAFMLLPENLLKKVKFPTKESQPLDIRAGQSGIAAKLGFASKTLLDLQESIENVSQKMNDISAHDIATVYDKTAEQLCKRCGLKLFCWETSYNEAMDAFNHVGQALRQDGRVTKESLPIYFRQKCCKAEELAVALNHNYRDFLARENANRRVSEVRSVAIEQFNGIADMLCEVSKELAEIQQFDCDAQQKVKEILESFSEQPTEVGCMLDRYGRMSVEVYFDTLFHTNLTVITEALSEALKRDFALPSRASVNGEEKLSFFEKADYRLEFYAVQQNAIGGQACGDCYEYFSDGKGFAHMILSDGMGSGTRAAVDSVMTCNLFLKLVKAGFGFEAALKLLNSSLFIKSVEESLATLDVGRIDLYTGKLEMMKAGAAASFVYHKGLVQKVDCCSLPVGILQGVHFARAEVALADGDILVMVSDGALETGEEWLAAEIELYCDKNAAELATYLCREAQRRRMDGHSDDITVMVSKIKKAG